jgi:hypothetical protein
MRIHILIAGSFGDREFAESASRLRSQNRRDSATLDRSIVRREKWNSSCAPNSFAVEFESYFDVRSVGVAEDMWRELSAIIRFESAARAARILRWSVALRDALRPRPAR